MKVRTGGRTFEIADERVRGGVDARHATDNGSRRDPAIHKTSSQRSELAPAPYRSKWEAAYASKLEQEKQAGMIKAYWHEPFSLWLTGKVRYKPDFLVQYPDGMECKLELIEVKGWSRNRRDGMTRLKIAAALFPCFKWILAYRVKGGGWEQDSL